MLLSSSHTAYTAEFSSNLILYTGTAWYNCTLFDIVAAAEAGLRWLDLT